MTLRNLCPRNVNGKLLKFLPTINNFFGNEMNGFHLILHQSHQSFNMILRSITLYNSAAGIKMIARLVSLPITVPLISNRLRNFSNPLVKIISE